MSGIALRLLVGLGNPGPRYSRSRHNAGFLVLERLAAGRGWTGRGSWEEMDVALEGVALRFVRPLTFMNRSGLALAEVFRREPYRPEEMLVVYDDVDMPWGRLRLRPRGGPGGHRGMESLVAELGSDAFARLRVGVGNPPEGQALEDYVLEPVEGDLGQEFDRIVEEAAEAVRLLLREGIGKAMNEVNPAPLDRTEPREPREPNGGGWRHDG